MTRRSAIDRICIHCGTSFHRSPSTRGATCSAACRIGYAQSHPLALRHLWSRVDKSDPMGCWPWTGWLREDGYGEVVVRRKKVRAHRVAYELATGEDLGERDCLHSCDNPPCCRPDHLRPGTQVDNAGDAIARGRHSHGVRHGRARLNWKQVGEIRAGADSGVSQAALTRQYGVASSTISRIVKGSHWRH